MEDKAQTAFSETNRFYILGEFREELLKEIVVPLTKKIDELSHQKEAVIDIYLNSNGGYSHIADHIIRLMEIAKSKDIKVRTIIMARAYSAASMVAVAGSEGERYIDPFAEHLPHYGTFWGSEKHTPKQLDRETAHYKRYLKHMIEHYKKYCSIPEVEKELEDDNFFIPADKAIKWGVADKYLEDL